LQVSITLAAIAAVTFMVIDNPCALRSVWPTAAVV
jgi:cation transport ATPase